MSNRPPLLLSSSVFSGTPTSINGCAFWTKAKDLTPGTQAFLTDLSGRGNHTATQATVGARMTATANQLNGKTTLLADGNDTYAVAAALYAISNGNNTTFVVSKRNTESGSANLLIEMEEATDARFYITYSNTAGSIAFLNRTADANTISNTGNTNTNYQIITAQRVTTTQSLAVDGGTAATNASAQSESGCVSGYIGSRNGSSIFLTGGIAEIIMYDRALSAAEILQVELYLANEWGIYHPNAQWINSYTAMQQAIIHALKLNKDDVGTNTTGNTVAAYYDPSRQATGATTSLTDYGRGVNTATEATNPPVNTANGIDGQNALLYNGTTTVLNAGSDSSVDNIFATGGTFIAVIKPTTTGETGNGRLFDKLNTFCFLNNTSGSACQLHFRRIFSTTNGNWNTTSRDITLGATNIVAVTYNESSVANNPAIYINSLTAKAVTTTLVPVGTSTTDAAQSLIIGNSIVTTVTFDGYIGEVFFTKQLLTAGQLSTIITPLAAKYGVTLT